MYFTRKYEYVNKREYCHIITIGNSDLQYSPSIIRNIEKYIIGSNYSSIPSFTNNIHRNH